MNVFVVLTNGKADAVYTLRTQAERHKTGILQRTSDARVEIYSVPFFNAPQEDDLMGKLNRSINRKST